MTGQDFAAMWLPAMVLARTMPAYECGCGRSGRQLRLHFLRSLKEIQGDGHGAVGSLLLERNQLQASADGSQRPAGTGELESLPVSSCNASWAWL